MSGEQIALGLILLVASMALINLMVIGRKINRIKRILYDERDARIFRERHTVAPRPPPSSSPCSEPSTEGDGQDQGGVKP